MPRLSLWQKLLALLVAVGLHMALAVAVFWQAQVRPRGMAQQAGEHGFQVALGPAGGAPGSTAAPHVETAQPKPVEAPKPGPEPEKMPPKPKETQSERGVVQPKSPVVQKSAPQRTAAELLENTSASVAGAGGKSGTRDQAGTGHAQADDTTGGGVPGTVRDYVAMLQAWLEQHKEYPRRAQRRRQQGTALLYFVMNRDGDVVRYRLERSSGYRLLDQAVVDMIERAQPLPVMPEGMARQQLELRVPVQFYLR